MKVCEAFVELSRSRCGRCYDVRGARCECDRRHVEVPSGINCRGVRCVQSQAGEAALGVSGTKWVAGGGDKYKKIRKLILLVWLLQLLG